MLRKKKERKKPQETKSHAAIYRAGGGKKTIGVPERKRQKNQSFGTCKLGQGGGGNPKRKRLAIRETGKGTSGGYRIKPAEVEGCRNFPRKTW